MYIQAAFNHNKPSPATLGSQHNLEEKIVQSLSLPCPALPSLSRAHSPCSPELQPLGSATAQAAREGRGSRSGAAGGG